MTTRHLTAAALAFILGCGGDAGLDLSAADALMAVSDQMATAIREYHREVCAYDTQRESQLVDAFVARLQQSIHDDQSRAADTHEFKQALAKVRADRDIEHARRQAAMDNIEVYREIARGLRKLALESLGLQDEVRRYLGRWLATRQTATDSTATGGNQ